MPPRGVGRPRSPKNFRPINFKSNPCRVRYVRIERTPNSALAKYWTYYARAHIHTHAAASDDHEDGPRRSVWNCIARARPRRHETPPPIGCLPARRYYASLIGNGKRLPSLLQIFVNIRDRGRLQDRALSLSLSLSLSERSEIDRDGDSSYRKTAASGMGDRSGCC